MSDKLASAPPVRAISDVYADIANLEVLMEDVQQNNFDPGVNLEAQSARLSLISERASQLSGELTRLHAAIN